MSPLIMKAAAAAAISFIATPILADYTTTLHPPDVDNQSILASIITAGSSSTTYLLSCPANEADYDCGLGTGITVVEGPSTVACTYSGFENTVTYNCNVDGGTSATCTMSYASSYSTDEASVTGADTSVVDWKGMAVTVTVTAGETYSGPADAGQTTTPAEGGLGTTTDKDPVGQEPTGVSKSKSSSASSVEASQTGTATASSSQTSAAASASSSSGGLPRVTGNAVMAGAAAVLGGVLMI